MKKSLGLILIIIAAFMLSGCELVKDIALTAVDVALKPDRKELREKAGELCEQTIKAVSDRDGEGLFGLVCENNRNDALRGDIEGLFEATGGEIISYGEPERISHPIHFISDSIDYAMIRFTVSDIDFGGGRVYSADLVTCAYSVFDKGHTGLQYLALYDGEDLLCRIGGIIEYYEPEPIPTEFTPVEKDHLFAEPLMKEFVDDLLYYLSRADREGFVSMFKEDTRKLAAEKFDDITALIGGSLVSYSRVSIDSSVGGSYKYDHFERLSGAASVYDLLTDNSRLLEIELSGWFVNLTEPAEEGISSFTIRLVENEINDRLEHDIISEVTVKNLIIEN